VSDFGLTKFKEEVKEGNKEVQGSVHWTAPEILNEAMDVDYAQADIYSFGIILWELLTRQQPYAGMRSDYSSQMTLLSGPRSVQLDTDWFLICFAGWWNNSPAAVAVAVIRDNVRPALPDDDQLNVPIEFVDLIQTCWHQEPSIRPSFLVWTTHIDGLSWAG